MPTRTMTVSQWIKVQDNPIQRDTERRAAKATHLLRPLLVHAIVFAAELPNGKLVKLDGHTRALLWSRNEVRHPPSVEVHLVPVANIEEATELYKTFDSKEALETVVDKISGAFGQQHFRPQSNLLQRGSVANALRVAWNVKTGRSITGGSKGEFNVYDAVTEFSNELFALDAYLLKATEIKSGLVAAFLITFRKHGSKILPFWQAVFTDDGEKRNGRMDGVQALNEMVLAAKANYGGSAVAEMCSRAVSAAEKWLAKETLASLPRRYDLRQYLDHATPATVLIKKPSAAA